MTIQIRVVLIDDNPDIHDVVKCLIEATVDVVLIGQAYDGVSGVRLCKVSKPDLVLMDVVMSGMNGILAARQIMKYLPRTKILILSNYHEYKYIRQMLDSGVIGYLAKDGITQDLITTIRSIMQGNIVLSPKVARTLFTIEKTQSEKATSNTTDFGLTERELQVLELLAKGLTYNDIAQKLRISQPTVRFHMSNILEKMDINTRSEALVLAAKNNLV